MEATEYQEEEVDQGQEWVRHRHLRHRHQGRRQSCQEGSQGDSPVVLGGREIAPQPQGNSEESAMVNPARAR